MGSVRIGSSRTAMCSLDRRIIFLACALALLLVAVAPLSAAPAREVTVQSGGDGSSQAMRVDSAPRSEPVLAPHRGGGNPPGGSSGHSSGPPPRGSRPPGGGHGDRGYGAPSSHHHGSGGYSRPYYSPSWGWGAGYYWGLGAYWPGWWGYPYYGYRYGPNVVVVPHDSGTVGEGVAALDLDVVPERASVYIDGSFVGVCDDFDGFPDYLWLRPGTYDLVIYQDGYQTISRQISVNAGEMVDIEDRMEPGAAVRPEDLPSKSTVRRDERLRREQERLREAAAGDPTLVAPQNAPSALDLRGEPGRLRLTIEPGDASVYLDGRFLGTGEELARLHAGLLIDPGKHELQVVRPGYAAVEREFDAEAGREAELDVSLEKD